MLFEYKYMLIYLVFIGMMTTTMKNNFLNLTVNSFSLFNPSKIFIMGCSLSDVLVSAVALDLGTEINKLSDLSVLQRIISSGIFSQVSHSLELSVVVVVVVAVDGRHL